VNTISTISAPNGLIVFPRVVPQTALSRQPGTMLLIVEVMKETNAPMALPNAVPVPVGFGMTNARRMIRIINPHSHLGISPPLQSIGFILCVAQRVYADGAVDHGLVAVVFRRV
jgi:hypothetical protein